METISREKLADSFELSKDVQLSIIDCFKKNNVKFYKQFAGTGTLYITVMDDDDDDFKLRVANHDKDNIKWSGRESDGNIIYSDDMDSCDISNLLMEELPCEVQVRD